MGLSVYYMQSRVQHSEQWAINSLDVRLSLVGGLSGIIWGVLNLTFGSYESFKLDNSLIGSIYPTSPQDFSEGDGSDVASSERKAKEAMLRTVAERGKYFYNYSEYLATSFLNAFGCCRGKAWFERRLDRLKRHEEATEKLNNEIDIVKLLYVQRIG